MLGCTIQNVADIRLNNYTATELYPFREADIDLLEKSQKNVVCGHSFVLRHKTVADEIFI